MGSTKKTCSILLFDILWSEIIVPMSGPETIWEPRKKRGGDHFAHVPPPEERPLYEEKTLTLVFNSRFIQKPNSWTRSRQKF
jgi:hypothetical protein